ncbi:MAG: TetR family transcriptional regulator C-terminal domain-containing protein [Actinomycetota bacterium]|nr:TetR family transcriptional regulator C-terminal domain-containing protein [Actinomycetota bacterium]
MPTEPVTKRGRATRDRIVAAADTLVAERGVEGASLDQVLATAHASKSQLYHYFTGKSALVRAVIARRRDLVLGSQMPVLAELDSWDAIEQWLNMILESHKAQGLRGGCPIGSLASELADRDDAARTDLVESFAAWEGYLVDGLERMRARCELVPSADPQELATAVFAAMQGGLLLAKTRQDPEPLRIALNAALAHLRSFEAGKTERSKRATRSSRVRRR